MKTAKTAITREGVCIVRTILPLDEVKKPGFFNEFAKILEVGDFMLTFSHTGDDTDTMAAMLSVVVVNDERGVQTRELACAPYPESDEA